MNTMRTVSSGENSGVWVFDGDEEEFVGALVGGGGAVGEGVGDAVGDGDGDGVGDGVVGERVGDGVGPSIGRVQLSIGGLHEPEFKHVGHIEEFQCLLMPLLGQ